MKPAAREGVFTDDGNPSSIVCRFGASLQDSGCTCRFLLYIMWCTRVSHLATSVTTYAHTPVSNTLISDLSADIYQQWPHPIISPIKSMYMSPLSQLGAIHCGFFCFLRHADSEKAAESTMDRGQAWFLSRFAGDMSFGMVGVAAAESIHRTCGLMACISGKSVLERFAFKAPTSI